MRVLVLNAGSSSLKLSLVDDGVRVDDETVQDWDGADTDAVETFLERCGPPDAVGHRVVHGGPDHLCTMEVDDALLTYLDSPTSLAPLHNPRAGAAIRHARQALSDLPHVACFDTSFHRDLPASAATYALPREWNQRWSLRRYGAHGLSHAYAARRAAELLGRPPESLRTVTCHLGSGSSLAAVAGGRSVDTTMGLTPLEGLVMSHRSGTVDPGLLVWLLTAGGLDVDELADALQRRSGLAGLTGGSGDLRDVVATREAGDPDAVLAYDVLVHRLRRELGAMVAVLGGLDVLVFTGGIGEHHPALRTDAVATLGWAGVRLDEAANREASGDNDVSAPDAAVATLVIKAAEDAEVAREVVALLGD